MMKFNIKKSVLLVGIIMVSWTPLNVIADTAVRQPGPFPEGMDVWYNDTTQTNGVHDSILVNGADSNTEYNTQLRFNLSGLPLNPTQVNLVVYYGGQYATTPINWYFNTEQWHSGSIDWNNAPANFWLGQTPAPTIGWYSMNITSVYNAWRSGNSTYLNMGLAMKPAHLSGNKYNVAASSGYSNATIRPQLRVQYTPDANTGVPKHKWHLQTPLYSNRAITQSFGVDWAGGSICNGLIKKHNGLDYVATVGTPVYAVEDGIVKYVFETTQWGDAIVMEHINPSGDKYTTVYWHVDPSADVWNFEDGVFIPKGTQIATVANLGGNTHSHIGVRMESYDSSPADALSGVSPQTNCGGYSAFPASFVDMEDSSEVMIHN